MEQMNTSRPAGQRKTRTRSRETRDQQAYMILYPSGAKSIISAGQFFNAVKDGILVSDPADQKLARPHESLVVWIDERGFIQFETKQAAVEGKFAHVTTNFDMLERVWPLFTRTATSATWLGREAHA
jgi:hypothetical protein